MPHADAGLHGRTAGDDLVAEILSECKKHMPAYMVPAGIALVEGPLPRNPNGKIDRKTLSTAWVENNGA